MKCISVISASNIDLYVTAVYKNTQSHTHTYTCCQKKLAKQVNNGAYDIQQICQILADSTTTTYWLDDEQVPYLVYGGDQWVGYDNAVSLSIKVSCDVLASAVLAQVISEPLTTVLQARRYDGTYFVF